MQSTRKGGVGMIILWVILGLIVLFVLCDILAVGQVDKQAGQQENLQNCLVQADNTYNTAFEAECVAEGDVNTGPSCKININQATLLDNRHQDAISNCYLAYPQQ